MVTAVTYLGSIGLGMALVAVGLLLTHGDSDVDGDGDVEMEGSVDAEGSAEIDGDAGPDAAESSGTVGEGLSVLSSAGIGSLLVGFGAMGYMALWLHLAVVLQITAGIVGAVLIFRLTAWVKRLLVRSLESGRSEGEADLLYRPGTVSIPVPPRGAGRGQVLIQHGIRTFYVSARHFGQRELAAGEPVVITEVSDGVYTVEPYSPLE